MIGGRDKPYTLEDSESGKFVPFGCFDCRGIECIEFSFRDGWAAEGVRFFSLGMHQAHRQKWSIILILSASTQMLQA